MPKVRFDAQKWSRRSAAAAPDYAKGVASPRQPWAASTVAAAQNYNDGVTQAISEGRFASGVQAAGDARWQQRASTVGPGRYGEGVRSSEGRYAQAMQPVIATIEATQLPPRGPRGSAQNYDRSRLIGEALNTQRRGGSRR